MRNLLWSAMAIPLVTSHLRQGTLHYHFVTLGTGRPKTETVWTAERLFTAYHGRPAMMQVSTYQSARDTTVDSLMFDRATLLPIWEHSNGTIRASVAFAGTHVTGHVARGDSSERPIAIGTTVPVYAGAIDEVVVQSVPLATGYTVVLPFYNAGTIEVDSICVRGREGNTWRVDLVWPGGAGKETLWIRAATRAIERHIYTYRDGSRAALNVD